jgi:Dna[CI] antecedent, DciA
VGQAFSLPGEHSSPFPFSCFGVYPVFSPPHDKMKLHPDMERASKVIRKLSLSGDIITPEQMALAVWPHAVGKRIAAQTRAAKLVRTRLVIEVPDATWQRQLFALSGFIVRNLTKDLGPGIVEDVEFRVVPRRREPARALTATPASAPLFADEADAIADPVLRDLYKLSRKRALA